MVTFKAPPAGTIQRAAPLNPITAIGKSIVGVFIGIGLILLIAPVMLWFAESQNTAKVFSFSKEVSSTSGASGYIRTMDIAKADSPIACYENKVEGNCLYYDYKLEELQYEVKDYCGKLQKDQQVIEEKGQKCHLDSNNEEKCEQCYLVNESNWNVAEHVMKFQSFTLGDFKVSYPSKAKVIGAEEYEKQIDATHRESMEYLKDNMQLLVAGSSDDSTISDGGDKKFLLVSSMDYDGTYEALKAQDRFIAWLLRITAFILLVIGYKMIFGPISVMSNFVRKIPFLGKWIDNAADFIIMLVSLLLAIVHFILLWILIMLLKNIVIIAIVVAVGLGLFYLYTRFKKPPQQVMGGIVIVAILGIALFSPNYQVQKEDVTGHVTFATLEKETKIEGTVAATPARICADSDNGKEYTVQGTMKGGKWYTTGKSYGTKTDSCTDSDTLKEYYCPDTTHGAYQSISCEDKVGSSYICDNGACAPRIVYIGSNDDYLYALSADDGAEVWKFNTGDDVKSSPTVANGIVYVGSVNGYVYALDADDGSEIWKFDIATSAGPDVTVLSSSVYTTVADGVVYISSSLGYVNALDADDGSEIWTSNIGDFTVGQAPLTVADGIVYIGAEEIYALDADDGSEIWKYDAGELHNMGSSPAVVDGIVYVGVIDTDANNVGYIYALDADDGSEVWKYETEWVYSSPTVVDGVVYIGSSDDYVYALDADDGSEIWKYETGGWVRSSPTVVDGILYVGSVDGYVYALDANDGSEIWKYETGDWVQSSPTVADGIVYVGSDDFNVYALDADDGSEIWKFETDEEVDSSPFVYTGEE